MKTLSMSEALNIAIKEEMEFDPNLIVLGQDIGNFGGAFHVTKGLIDKFGHERIRDTPISEAAMIGCGVGAAMMGYPTIVEMQYSDFITIGFDQVVNQAAKIHFMSGGRINIPLVIRMPSGAQEHGAQHDQSLESLFMHIPGLKVVIPSTAYDAKGLLKSSIRDRNPVLFFEHKLLYGTVSTGGHGSDVELSDGSKKAMQKGIPDEEYLIPLGKADIKKEGNHVTVIATALMVHHSLEAANELREINLDVEVVDLRTLVPLDTKAIFNSVRKTGKAVVVTEENSTGSSGSYISALISEHCFEDLDMPVKRLNVPDVPFPFAPIHQLKMIPGTKEIAQAIVDIAL